MQSLALSPDRKGLERRAAAVLELRRRESVTRDKRNTVVGFVCPKQGHTHSIHVVGGQWVATTDKADVYLAAVLERAVRSNKRFIAIIGGRGSGKSIGVADIALIGAKDNQEKSYCLREYQSSIKNSIQSLLTSEVERLEFSGFTAQGNSFLYKDQELFQFAGLARNVDSIKSAHGFKRFLVEESQFISTSSLRALTPTARNKPNKGLPKSDHELETEEFKGVSMIFVANPGSSADPFSQRFIKPFENALLKDGYYEDDLHLIIKCNYTDNPWYLESDLEKERKFDEKNLSTAEYSHIWLGAYNDEVKGSIIPVDWFNAAIDAHVNLGFKPTGAKIAAHDPSDEGGDAKGYALRHGSVILDAAENETGDVNEGCDWAIDRAIESGADFYAWDCDGLGVSLKRQTLAAFDGKKAETIMFKGSEAPDDKDSIYEAVSGDSSNTGKTNRQVFKNKRAQYYWRLRDRFYKTYRAISNGEYIDPDELISISSEIDCIDQLRAEVCRVPKKPNPNGLIQIMSKVDMIKMQIESPNMADSLMMLMMIPETKTNHKPINFTSEW